ncbi:MAG: YhdH/YhfP family quinone oxidoreductase [Flavobacteriales bacterium]
MNSPTSYTALVVRESTENRFERGIEALPFSFLPEHDVTIRVEAAALNYKDALSAHGHKGITRQYPHTPGVDAAGYVVDDCSGRFAHGTPVICTSYDLGMNTPGGFAEYIRVPADWIVQRPSSMDAFQAMVFGTAAYTAALALWKMERCGQSPEMGPIAVTGATGGVGSLAVALLAHAGYKVIAITGSLDQHNYLRALGATEILPREEANDTGGRLLLRPKWAGAIDNVGGNTLTTLLKACGRNGSVASIGLVGSPDFSATVYPFILNGVNLLGVDSAETPRAIREEIWRRLANEWAFSLPKEAVTETTLSAIPKFMEAILNGKTTGRVVARI